MAYRMRSLSVPKIELRRVSRMSHSVVGDMSITSGRGSYFLQLSDTACDLCELYLAFDVFRRQVTVHHNGTATTNVEEIKKEDERPVPLANIEEALETPGVGLDPTPVKEAPRETTPSPSLPNYTNEEAEPEILPTQEMREEVDEGIAIGSAEPEEEKKESNVEAEEVDEGVGEAEKEEPNEIVVKDIQVQESLFQEILENEVVSAPGMVYRFTSFEHLKAMSEPLKILLVYLDLQWEEKMLTEEEWTQRLENGDQVIPVMHLDEEDSISGPLPVSRYIAREHGLEPEDSYDREKVEMVAKQWSELLYSLREDWLANRFIRDWPSVKNEKLVPFLDSISGTLQENDATWFCQDKMSWVDLVIGDLLVCLKVVDPDLLQEYPTLKHLVANVWNIASVQAYREQNKNIF